MRFIIKDRRTGLYLRRREHPALYGIMNDWVGQQDASVLGSVRQAIRFVSRSDDTMSARTFKNLYTLVLLNPQQQEN